MGGKDVPPPRRASLKKKGPQAPQQPATGAGKGPQPPQQSVSAPKDLQAPKQTVLAGKAGLQAPQQPALAGKGQGIQAPKQVPPMKAKDAQQPKPASTKVKDVPPPKQAAPKGKEKPRLTVPAIESMKVPGETPCSPRGSRKGKRGRMRTHRYTSNVFSMFSQDQIQEFKEAFNMMDQNHDGFIDREDLMEMLTSLGKNPTEEEVNSMIGEAPGPLNFTMFLTLFGEKLNGTDPEDVIRNAFGCFDFMATGKLEEWHLREIMTTLGDRWTDDMVDELFHGAPIANGLFDYLDFTKTLKHGSQDDNEGPQKAASKPKQECSSNRFTRTVGGGTFSTNI